MGSAEALKLLEGMDRLVAVRGKKVQTFSLTKDRPDDETLLSYLIGPTGNLRAPAARVGKSFVVGFDEQAYRDLLGV